MSSSIPFPLSSRSLGQEGFEGQRRMVANAAYGPPSRATRVRLSPHRPVEDPPPRGARGECETVDTEKRPLHHRL